MNIKIRLKEHLTEWAAGSGIAFRWIGERLEITRLASNSVTVVVLPRAFFTETQDFSPDDWKEFFGVIRSRIQAEYHSPNDRYVRFIEIPEAVLELAD